MATRGDLVRTTGVNGSGVDSFVADLAAFGTTFVVNVGSSLDFASCVGTALDADCFGTGPKFVPRGKYLLILDAE